MVVVEEDTVVGGISRTVERDGWRFDIGGHRFFTKVKPVEEFWHKVLPPEDFLLRPRMSRIYYDGKFYDYPIKVGNALSNLGVVEAFLCGLSFLWVRIRPPKDLTTLEGYIVSNYGWRLYRHFFKTYNEKVWAVSASEISADWGAQRIKGMSLWNAVWEPIRASVAGKRRDKSKQVTSLIEEFEYPKYGPGMMWERCAEQVVDMGGTLRMSTTANDGPRRGRGGGGRHRATRAGRARSASTCSHVISSMPLTSLARIVDPPVPDEVLAAADDLHYRDFLTVALVVPEERGFPDNWIYIHSPDVKVGRIQNFGVWSPFLVKDGRTCLGMEYFVFEGDELWNCSDDDLVALATKELAVHRPGRAVRRRGRATWCGCPRPIPVYDDVYRDNVEIIRQLVRGACPQRPPGGPQRHAQIQQPGPLHVHGHAHGGEHPRCPPRHLGGERRRGVPRDGNARHGTGSAAQAEHRATGRDAPIIPRGAGKVGNVTT